jgi:thiamine biosynthesis protein ThiS
MNLLGRSSARVTEMQITINGEPRAFTPMMTIGELVERLELDAQGIAIERNMTIIPRRDYPHIALEEGDAIEIVEFIGGG